MQISHDKLNEIVPGGGRWAGAISAAAERFDISTPARMAAFIAQIAHESARFTRLVENLNYSAEGLARTWPGRYRDEHRGGPNDLAMRLHRRPEMIANNAYANRMGNGDEASGDGWRFRGRGLIQLTGRENYEKCGAALGLPLTIRPQLLEEKDAAALAAAWFWKVNGCNELADVAAFTSITRKINGGTHGIDDRVKLWNRAQIMLGVG